VDETLFFGRISSYSSLYTNLKEASMNGKGIFRALKEGKASDKVVENSFFF
jgi:hypothetical protein